MTEPGPTDVFEQLAPAEFVRRESSQSWQLLDVRECWETEVAAIERAIRIPMMEIPARLAELDARRPVAVICHSGVRSARVAEYLLAQGFATVANIAGGIDRWSLDVDDRVPRY